MGALTSTIFRAYDVRGTYPDQLNREVVEALGRAIGPMRGNKDKRRSLQRATVDYPDQSFRRRSTGA